MPIVSPNQVSRFDDVISAKHEKFRAHTHCQNTKPQTFPRMEPLPTIIPDQLRNDIPSAIEQEVGEAGGQDSSQSPAQNLSRHSDGKPRRIRSKWTQEETQDLVKGCSIHGVGSWKKYPPGKDNMLMVESLKTHR